MHRVDNFSGPLFGIKHSQIVSRVEVGAKITFAADNSSIYLENWLYFSGICTARNISASTLSISRFCNADIVCTPSTSCFDTAGTYLPVLSGFRTAHTRNTLSIYCTACIELIAASHLFRINIHLPMPSFLCLYIIVVMIPHYFLKRYNMFLKNMCAGISYGYYFAPAPLP